jgi:putative Holliday junction resolvase
VAIVEIERLVGEHNAVEIVVGLPLSLAGNHTASTEDALSFAHAIALKIGLAVRMVDERLSTVSAIGALRLSGRASKKQRSVVDQVAAVILLQHTLDTERSQGVAAGFLLENLPDHD